MIISYRGYMRDETKELEDAIREYLKNRQRLYDQDDQDHMIHGVMAFIWSNTYGKPYEVLSQGYYTEDKKWWQFWK